MLFYRKEQTCLFCERKFKMTKVNNNLLKVKKQDTDFFQQYDGDIHPLFYEVMVCPHCGYAYTKSSQKPYEPYKSILQKEFIEQVIKPYDFCEERNLEEAITSFKLLYHVGTIGKESQKALGNIALKLAWLYRIKEDPEQEKRFLARSLKHFETSYGSEKISSVDGEQDKIVYLLAELNLRLDNMREARRLFSDLITRKNVPEKYRTYALNRWEDYKMEQEEREQEGK